jgi:hypothetical protein
MVLIPQACGWVLRLRTDQGLLTHVILGADLDAALVEAEQLYTDACVVVNGKRRCQQCIHWRRVEGKCDFGFPEAKRTGGKHAQDCVVFTIEQP